MASTRGRDALQDPAVSPRFFLQVERRVVSCPGLARSGFAKTPAGGWSPSAGRESELSKRANKRREEAERQTARAESNLITAVNAIERTLSGVAAHQLKYVPQTERVRRELVVRAEELLNSLVEQPNDSIELQRSLAICFGQLAAVQIDLGEFEFANATLDRGFKFWEQLPDAERETPYNKFDLAQYHALRARILSALGSHDQGVVSSEKAIGLLEELRQQSPSDVRVLSALVGTYTGRVEYRLKGLWFAQAETDAEMARDFSEHAIALHPHEKELRMRYGFCLYMLACVYRDNNKLDDAEREYRAVLSIQQELLSETVTDSEAVELKSNRASSLKGLGAVLERQGDLQGAEQAYQDAEPILLDLAREFPVGPLFHGALGELYKRWARTEAALAHTSRVKELLDLAKSRFETAASVDQGTEDDETFTTLLVTSSQLYLQLREYRTSIQAADDLPEIRGWGLDHLFSCVLLANCARTVEDDTTLDDVDRNSLLSLCVERGTKRLRVAREMNVQPNVANLPNSWLDDFGAYLDRLARDTGSHAPSNPASSGLIGQWSTRARKLGESFLDAVIDPATSVEVPPEPKGTGR